MSCQFRENTWKTEGRLWHWQLTGSLHRQTLARLACTRAAAAAHTALRRLPCCWRRSGEPRNSRGKRDSRRRQGQQGLTRTTAVLLPCSLHTQRSSCPQVLPCCCVHHHCIHHGARLVSLFFLLFSSRGGAQRSGQVLWAFLIRRRRDTAIPLVALPRRSLQATVSNGD